MILIKAYLSKCLIRFLMHKISTVIITKNEETNIERCLLSVVDFSDEIIVVDDFSTDQTPAICKRYHVVFVQNKFKDFASQKNIALSKAKQALVFSIDADEEVSEKLKQSILAVKSNSDSLFYSMNRQTNYLGKWIRYSGWYPDTKIRLWQKEHARWQGAVHEVLQPKPQEVKHLKGDILHYSFPSLQWHISKLNHFTDIAAERMFSRNKRVSLMKMLFSMKFNFLKKYVFQLGFLDGYHGFLIALMSSYYTLLKYAKLRHLQSKAKKQG